MRSDKTRQQQGGGAFLYEIWRKISFIVENQWEIQFWYFFPKILKFKNIIEIVFDEQANNDDMVYIVQQKDGKFRVLGNEMYQTDTTFDQKLGGAATDEMGTTFTVSVTDVCPAPFYIGEIVTADGIINAAA